ncbi:hypothetical protein NFI96_009062 [Prochilodus magdalenae]|nr:hypothetical protein NFI96_009062 [Prochilodus magdalenae]
MGAQGGRGSSRARAPGGSALTALQLDDLSVLASTCPQGAQPPELELTDTAAFVPGTSCVSQLFLKVSFAPYSLFRGIVTFPKQLLYKTVQSRLQPNGLHALPYFQEDLSQLTSYHQTPYLRLESFLSQGSRHGGGCYRREQVQSCDELEAAVSARASRHKTTESYAYSDDFDDDDDDDGLVEDKPPRPRPRQRPAHAGSSAHDEEDGPAGTPSSRAATSSVSIGLSFTDGPTTTTGSSDRMGSFGSDSIQCPEEHHVVPLTAAQGGYNDLLGPLEDTESSDLSVLEQSKGEKHSTAFEGDQQEGSEDVTCVTPSRQSQSTIKSQDRPWSSRPASSRKSKSAGSYTAESKYLGTLKVLDQKMALQETQPDAADSLRAAVYQDWLKKKEEKLQMTVKAKKQEEKLKEEKAAEEEMSKKADARAAYEAWKEKKSETLKDKIREKQEALRKQQKEKDDKEERKETAKRVFEKWKQEHNDLLREEQRKQAQAESRLKEKKEKEEEERRKDCNSTFSQWSEKKKDAIQEKVKTERKKEKIKEIEEKYEKEEREKMALEMYEKWLKRKEFQQKREKHEKKIRAIVEDEPPPPWSPPNRTIPFGDFMDFLVPIKPSTSFMASTTSG